MKPLNCGFVSLLNMTNSKKQNLKQEKQMVAAAQADPSKFSVLFEKYLDQIYNYIFHRIGDQNLTEDLTSEVFLKALENIQSFSWQGYPFSSWLYKIASNEVNQYYREHYKRTTISLHKINNNLSHNPDFLAHLTQKEKKEQVINLVASLPENQQEAITLRFSENLSYKEIGKIMGKKSNAVRQLVYRALENLRDLISANDEEN